MTKRHDEYLPRFDGVPEGFRHGRNVREGYVRGWGLQYGDLRERVRADPLYREALEVASGRTVVAEDNRMNIFLILKFFLPKLAPGNIVEFGSYRGGNALFMAYVAARLLPGVRVYALDTFAGMPETDHDVDAHRAGDFADVDLPELRRFAQSRRLDNVEFVQGLFEDTAPALLRRAGPVALAHIDCDIRSAVVTSYECVKPYMVPGGYIVFDDATVSSCIGATEAVEELLVRRDGLNSEQIFPHFVFRAAPT
jgi:predicted O-methyltransferase YrrM